MSNFRGVGKKRMFPRQTSWQPFMHFQCRRVFNLRRLRDRERREDVASSPSWMENAWNALHITEAEQQESRSGAAGWCYSDWEQREQLMIAYQRPRFTPSSCFWEWASSTAPQRRVCVWDLTFSNLIESNEKKPSSAYDPPPPNGKTAKVFLDDIVWG